MGIAKNTNKQKGRSNMRQYPIWIDTHNPSYANQFSKSMGVKNSSSSSIKIGTSAKNSYDFLNTRIETAKANNGSRVYNFFVDDKLIKSAFYNDKLKDKMRIVYSGADKEEELKKEYFSKWKAQEEAEAQKFRNERYAERLAVNGQV